MNIDYLKAEIAKAQQEGKQRIPVSIGELLSMIYNIEQYEGAAKAKIFGYAIGTELRNICSGYSWFINIKRKATGRHDTPVYFQTIKELTDEEKLRVKHLGNAKHRVREEDGSDGIQSEAATNRSVDENL